MKRRVKSFRGEGHDAERAVRIDVVKNDDVSIVKFAFMLHELDIEARR